MSRPSQPKRDAQILAKRKKGYSLSELAKLFKISKSRVFQICKGQ